MSVRHGGQRRIWILIGRKPSPGTAITRISRPFTSTQPPGTTKSFPNCAAAFCPIRLKPREYTVAMDNHPISANDDFPRNDARVNSLQPSKTPSPALRTPEGRLDRHQGVADHKGFRPNALGDLPENVRIL
jgi:hypothetical protein